MSTTNRCHERKISFLWILFLKNCMQAQNRLKHFDKLRVRPNSKSPTRLTSLRRCTVFEKFCWRLYLPTVVYQNSQFRKTSCQHIPIPLFAHSFGWGKEIFLFFFNFRKNNFYRTRWTRATPNMTERVRCMEIVLRIYIFRKATQNFVHYKLFCEQNCALRVACS